MSIHIENQRKINPNPVYISSLISIRILSTSQFRRPPLSNSPSTSPYPYTTNSPYIRKFQHFQHQNGSKSREDQQENCMVSETTIYLYHFLIYSYSSSVILVIAQAIFSPVDINAMVQTLYTTFHIEKLYGISECLLFNYYSTFDVFFTTDSLSHRMILAGWYSDIGIPNIHSFNLRC